jgi:hypothetical protein
MANLTLDPGASLGGLRLGDSRMHVHDAIGEIPRVFDDGHGRHADYFVERELKVFYDDAGNAERIVAFEPNCVTYATQPLMGRTREEIAAIFKSAGFAPQESATALVDAKAGVGVQLRHDKVWTVEVFVPGYDSKVGG